MGAATLPPSASLHHCWRSTWRQFPPKTNSAFCLPALSLATHYFNPVSPLVLLSRSQDNGRLTYRFALSFGSNKRSKSLVLVTKSQSAEEDNANRTGSFVLDYRPRDASGSIQLYIMHAYTCNKCIYMHDEWHVYLQLHARVWRPKVTCKGNIIVHETSLYLRLIVCMLQQLCIMYKHRILCIQCTNHAISLSSVL